MARFWVVAAVVAVAFMVYSLVDCAMTDKARVRGPRKGVWLLLILVLPVIGAVLWFVIGRGRPTKTTGRAPLRPVAPDDDPAFLARLARDADQEERIRRLEEELSALESDPDADPDGKDGTDGTGGAGRRDG
ncbi:PLDc N-terminal domain-containing protein [Amnibacterium flavum]|uniref:Cardiolipin synthase N-terminal domain-containing protein n=1 Tax=Amnibacterium flavum TaxID=2173173 RepID=A0A2V1HSN9_9MICO|nr:PLDc N-terminal domain-containing protein [Amnibacterium flavum]PVZ95603.1 hypothetical protein DDQ50_03670 [Amnibacterium flavum]